jgi:predicted nucleic acid-binding protein
VALREGLAIIGVVGVLVAAKQKGLVPSIAGLLTRLEMEAGFRLSGAVKGAALRAVGE